MITQLPLNSSISLIQEEFTPGEAASITGVSVELQREWRRRKIERPLARGKHPRWKAYDLGRLFVRGEFSKRGISVKQTSDLAWMAEGSIGHFISQICLKGNAFAGMFGVQSTTDLTHVSRYIIWADGNISRSDDIAAWLDSNRPFFLAVMDCEQAAKLIIDRAPRIPVRIEVREGK